ncbi:MAG: HigA family addiction module antitoxin [Eubacteriales bacterium]|nr:HigA family addiction module antitoxin [Eubacteriales bacterium]MDD3072908.1 HigA family addiction module antitoxin [Eubacteriales bacterium]MDD4079666.1 HigA family addiction module antitoxin [Eubacteriales bacterium]MDD4769822.1 HigA family addiction module antitoxin [Eubacteriales bacterium]
MAKNIIGLSREFIIHPGDTLKEILEDRKMSQLELALRTDVSDAHISSVVNGKKNISVSFAKKLEYALGIDAGFWVNLQANYEKELADYEEVNRIAQDELSILDKLKNIVCYLQQLGFLDQVPKPMLVIQLRKLLNVSSLRLIPEVSQAGAYRLATGTSVDPYVLFTWLRMCDLLTDQHQISCPLDLDRLQDKIPLIKELMFEDAARVQFGLKGYFAECGIKFVIVRHFPGAPVQGAIIRNNDGSLSLIMTFRRKFADIFWFTLFHEVGHIINGDIEDRLIDYELSKNEAENQADRYAANTLIDSEAYSLFMKSGDYSLDSIQRFCDEQNIPSYILIGRLHKEKYLKYHQYSDNKVRYEFEDTNLMTGVH